MKAKVFRDEEDQLEEEFRKLIDTYGFNRLLEDNDLTELDVVLFLFKSGIIVEPEVLPL
jgi:hypothetical protein